MPLTRDRMVDRMLAADPEFDGRFFTAVTTTGIYCLPSCRARKPKPANVQFFASREAAEAAGFRPCRRCRPHLFPADADLEALEQAVARFEGEADLAMDVGRLAESLSLGRTKLSELCRLHYHTTPHGLISSRRVARAASLLEDGAGGMADIAFRVGFGTLSSFNRAFRSHFATSPSTYRELASGTRHEIELSCPPWHATDVVLAYLGRDPASPCEQREDHRFAFATWTGGGPVRVDVEVVPGSVRVRWPSTVAGPGALSIHREVVALFGLGQDPRPFERRAHAVDGTLVAVPGLVIPQTRSPFDGVVWVIAGQQVSLAAAFAFRRRLVARYGAPVDGLVAPPRPSDLAEAEPEALVELGFSRSKAASLVGLARRITDGALDLEGLAHRPVTRIREALLSQRGLGPWSVDYLLMRSFGFGDCLPAGDAALARAVESAFGLEERPPPRRIEELLAPFSPDRSLATFQLWQRKTPT